MKPCEQVLLYEKGELSGAEKQAFEAHLKTCTDCRAELKFLEQLDAALAVPAAPQRAVDKLLARTTRKKSAWMRFKWAWTSAAAAVVCAVVGVGFFHSSAPSFSAQELVAYMNANGSDYYQWDEVTELEEELDDLENYL